jgi:hypothetical protein
MGHRCLQPIYRLFLLLTCSDSFQALDLSEGLLACSYSIRSLSCKWRGYTVFVEQGKTSLEVWGLGEYLPCPLPGSEGLLEELVLVKGIL